MSTRPYSIDLRMRVISYIEEGNSQRAAAKFFKISKSAVHQWYNRYKNKGHCDPKPNIGSKGKLNQQDIEDYVTKNPNVRLKDLSEIFKASISSIWTRLKKAGFSYKKKRTPTWKRTKLKGPNI